YCFEERRAPILGVMDRPSERRVRLPKEPGPDRRSGDLPKDLHSTSSLFDTRDLGLERFAEGRMRCCDDSRNLSPLLASNEPGTRWRARSEERRVGKEC